jgi:hypothetical protein
MACVTGMRETPVLVTQIPDRRRRRSLRHPVWSRRTPGHAPMPTVPDGKVAMRQHPDRQPCNSQHSRWPLQPRHHTLTPEVVRIGRLRVKHPHTHNDERQRPAAGCMKGLTPECNTKLPLVHDRMSASVRWSRGLSHERLCRTFGGGRRSGARPDHPALPAEVDGYQSRWISTERRVGARRARPGHIT